MAFFTPKRVFFLLLAGLALRLVLLGIFYDHERIIYDDDSNSYLPLAENIRLHHVFSVEKVAPLLPDAIRTPAVPVFFMVHRAVFGSYLPALVTQSIIIVLAAYGVYLIGRRLGRERAALVAMVLMLITPFSLLVSIRFLSQPLFVFFLVFATYFWIRYLQDGDRRSLIFALVLIPLLALTRPIAIFMPVPFIVSYLYMKRSWKIPLLIVAVFVAVISPWLYRNYHLFGHASLTSQGPVQLYFFDLPAIYARVNHVSYEQGLKAVSDQIAYLIPPGEEVTGHWYGFRNFAYGSVIQHAALVYIAHHPFATIQTRIGEIIMVFLRDGVRYWTDNLGVARSSMWFILPAVAERGFLLVMFIGFLLGCLTMLSKKFENEHKAAFFAVLCVVAYCVVLTGALTSAGFRFPVEGLIFLVSCIGWQEAYLWYQAHKRT